MLDSDQDAFQKKKVKQGHEDTAVKIKDLPDKS
jgi:hypothetical protein